MRKDRLIVIVLLVLAALTAIAAALHLSSRTQVTAGTIRVEWDGGASEAYLTRLELHSIHGTVRNGKGEELAVDGEGALLSAVLEELGVTDFGKVTVTAEDSYSAVVTAEEVAQPDKVYLMLQERGGAQLVVFGDENSKRNVANVAVLTAS